MWHHLRGKVHSYGTDHVVVEAQGIGWLVATPIATAQKARQDEDIFLWLHHHLSMDPNRGGEALYGFDNGRERDLFRLLMTVKGIGPRQALIILSGCGVDPLVRAIRAGDDGILKKIKGVGSKTAQRLVLELKESIDKISSGTTLESQTPDVLEDTISALVSLGYKEAESRRAAEAARRKNQGHDDVADLVRSALHEI